MNRSWLHHLRTLILTAGLGLAAGGCAHVDPVTPPSGPPPPATTGTVDCSAAAIWTTTSFASLIPPVERAAASDSPADALGALLQTHSSGEVGCVVGYVHDQSVAQSTAAPGDPLPGRRVAATQSWLDQQTSKGLTVTHYQGESH